MARLPRTSAASYALFKARAWNVLSSPGVRAQTVGEQADALYGQCYAEGLDPAVAAKVPQTGRTLYRSMVSLIVNAGTCPIRIQTGGGAWPILTALHQAEYQAWVNYWGHWAITRCLCCCCLTEPDDLSNEAAAATEAYLHIYPQLARNVVANWRVAFNIKPESIAAAVTAVVAVMNLNADIDHFKVTAPGYAGKPDSLIVYMNKNNVTYAAIRLALENAVNGLAIQPTFNPLWNEFALGEAEASEPPTINYTHNLVNNVEFTSFGTYRCLLSAMAFQAALSARQDHNPANVTQIAFDNALDAILPQYGVPLGNPHEQNALNFVFNDPLNVAFMHAYGDQMGTGDGYVQVHAVLTDV